MTQGLSSEQRISNVSGTRQSGDHKVRPLTLVAVHFLLAIFLVSILAPAVSATYEYFPTEEYIVASKGTRVSGTFPDDLEKPDNIYIHYETEDDAVNSDLDLRMNFTAALQHPFVYQLRIRFKSFDWSVILTCNPCFSVQVYDGSSWNQRITNLLDSDWTEVRYMLTTAEAMVLGGPQIKFLWHDATVGPYDLYLDRVYLIDYIQELHDEIDDLQKQIDELRKLIEEDVVTDWAIEPFVPSMTRGDVMPGLLLADPYALISMEIVDICDPPASSCTHVTPVDSAWDDAWVTRDTVAWHWSGSLSRVYVNSTTAGAGIKDTADDAVWYLDLISEGYEGDAVTVEGLSDTVSSVREINEVWIDSFIYTIDPSTMERSVTLAFSNDLTLNWRNVYIWIGADDDASIDPTEVELKDLNTGIVLTQNKHYRVTSGGIDFSLNFLNASVSNSYSLTWRPFYEIGQISEPSCTFRYSAASNADLDNRVWLYSECTFSNSNPFKYTGRATIDLSEIPGNIEMIRVRSLDGTKEYTLGSPLGNKWYVVQNVIIEANGMLKVDIYVKAPEPTVSVGAFTPWIPFLFVLFVFTFFIGVIVYGMAQSIEKMKQWERAALITWGASLLFLIVIIVSMIKV